MLAHLDNLVAAALEDLIVHGSGMKTCHARKRVARG